jgi:hypothetical protein
MSRTSGILTGSGYSCGLSANSVMACFFFFGFLVFFCLFVCFCFCFFMLDYVAIADSSLITLTLLN